MIAIEIITKEDLEKFKAELLGDIKGMITPVDAVNKKWLKNSEIRKLLNISPGTLQNLRINGTLPFTRIGSIIFYKLEDISSILEGGLR